MPGCVPRLWGILMLVVQRKAEQTTNTLADRQESYKIKYLEGNTTEWEMSSDLFP